MVGCRSSVGDGPTYHGASHTSVGQPVAVDYPGSAPELSHSGTGETPVLLARGCDTTVFMIRCDALGHGTYESPQTFYASLRLLRMAVGMNSDKQGVLPLHLLFPE
jgi:hypothetical protein